MVLRPTPPAERFALAALRSAGNLLQILPVAAARGLARGLARAYLHAGGRRVRWARQNLCIAFPSWSAADRDGVARASFANFLLDLIDLRRSETWNADEVLARFRFEGLEHLRRALASGRGALLLSLHMGCYDLGLRALSLKLPGLRLATIAHPLSPQLQAWLDARRNAGSVEILQTGSASGVRALRILRSGRPLIVLNDLYLRQGRRFAVPLFGKRCLTPAGPAVLALATGAHVLPCYVRRDGPDRHGLHILPEVELPADEEAGTAACNTALEGIIRKHPEQWNWAHRRFRYSPDLPPGLYRPVR